MSNQRQAQFQARLKRLRTARNMSQADLAAKSGFSREHISRLENGHHSPFRAGFTTPCSLADALGVSYSELLE